MHTRIQNLFTAATFLRPRRGLIAAGIAALVWAVPAAHAQGSRYDNVVFNAQGRPMAGATITVCTQPTSGSPCTTPANIYSDVGLTQALANPTTADGLGNYTFYAAPGIYEIDISGPAIITRQIPNIVLPSNPTSPSFSSLTVTGACTGCSVAQVFSSSSYATPNSNLQTGGGTDATSALQTVLNSAPNYPGGIELWVNGPYLISGLNVLSNTTIRCFGGGGFYLKNASNREAIRNVDRSTGSITDQNISIVGCYVNGNRANQTQQQSDNTYNSAIGFYGVQNATLRGNHIYNSVVWAVNFSNYLHVTVDGDWYEQSTTISNLVTDGIDLRGGSDATLENLRIKSGDDGIALNGINYGSGVVGPYVTGGNNTHIRISNIYFDGAWSGVDLISGTASSTLYTADDVTINGLHGTVQNFAWWINTNGHDPGSFGTLSVSNVDAAQVGPVYGSGGIPTVTYDVESTVGSLTLANNLLSGQPVTAQEIKYETTAYVNALNVGGTLYAVAAGSLTANIGGTVTDAFQRANGSVGANYTAFNVCGDGSALPTISSDKVVGQHSTAYDFGYYTGQTFDQTQFAQVTIGDGGADSSAAQAAGVRFTSSGGYIVRAFNGAIGVLKVTTSGGCGGYLAGPVTQAVATGDVIQIQANGAVISAWYEPNGGSAFTQLTSVTDGTYPTGAPAAGVFGNTAHSVITSFSGGSLNQPNPFKPVVLTDGTPITWNVANQPSGTAEVTLSSGTGTRALAITNMAAGGLYILYPGQDTTGGTALTLSTTGCNGTSHWKAGSNGMGAITLNTSANDIDRLEVQYDGSNCFVTLTTQFN